MDGNALNYKLNFSELSFFENIKNMFTVFSRLSSLAIYPFREGQNISYVIIFNLFIIYPNFSGIKINKLPMKIINIKKKLIIKKINSRHKNCRNPTSN